MSFHCVVSSVDSDGGAHTVFAYTPACEPLRLDLRGGAASSVELVAESRKQLQLHVSQNPPAAGKQPTITVEWAEAPADAAADDPTVWSDAGGTAPVTSKAFARTVSPSEVWARGWLMDNVDAWRAVPGPHGYQVKTFVRVLAKPGKDLLVKEVNHNAAKLAPVYASWSLSGGWAWTTTPRVADSAVEVTNYGQGELSSFPVTVRGAPATVVVDTEGGDDEHKGGDRVQRHKVRLSVTVEERYTASGMAEQRFIRCHWDALAPDARKQWAKIRGTSSSAGRRVYCEAEARALLWFDEHPEDGCNSTSLDPGEQSHIQLSAVDYGPGVVCGCARLEVGAARAPMRLLFRRFDLGGGHTMCRHQFSYPRATVGGAVADGDGALYTVTTEQQVRRLLERSPLEHAGKLLAWLEELAKVEGAAPWLVTSGVHDADKHITIKPPAVGSKGLRQWHLNTAAWKEEDPGIPACIDGCSIVVVAIIDPDEMPLTRPDTQLQSLLETFKE